MGTNAVAEFLRRAPKEDSLPSTASSGESRCATSNAWRPEHTGEPGVDSHATHAHADQAAGPRRCGRDDRGRVDESCAMVSSLTEEVQQRKGEQATLQDVVVIVRSTT